MSKHLFTLVLTTLTVCSVAADAQETIEEIQVTATRRPAATTDVSAALTIIDAEVIRQSKLVTDALAAQPGVFLQQTTPGQGAAIIRGLKGSEVLHLVDGFRLNNAIFRNAPTQYLALVAPGSTQQIEIVRGAPTSLYGSDAVGGVLQVVTRMPSFDVPGTRTDLYLAYDTAELGKVVRAGFEAGDENFAGLISAEYLRTGNRDVGDGPRVAPSGYESKGARIAATINARENSQWLLDFHFGTQPATPRVDELVAGFDQTEPASAEFLFAPNERSFAHIRNIRSDWLWSADWTIALGWQQVRDDRTNRNTGSDLRRHEQNSSDLFGLTISAARQTDWWTWVAGAEFYYDEVASRRQEEDIDSGMVQSIQARFPDQSSMQQAALFANLQRAVTERHRLSAGIRLSAIEVDIPETGQLQRSTLDQEDLSADLGWIFDLSNNTQFVANVGYGFRAPNIFDLGTLGERPGNRFNVPNPELKSERVTQIDAGIRHSSEHGSIDFTAFALHYTDRISSALTGAETPSGRDIVQSRNVETADIIGLEAVWRYTWTDTLSTILVVNYQRGEQEEANGVTVSADRMPPLNGRLSVAYDWQERVLIEPYLAFAGGQHRLSPRDRRDSRIDPNGTPGWVTANVAASWHGRSDWRVRVALENLLNRRYRMHGSGIDAVGANLVLSVAVSF